MISNYFVGQPIEGFQDKETNKLDVVKKKDNSNNNVDDDGDDDNENNANNEKSKNNDVKETNNAEDEIRIEDITDGDPEFIDLDNKIDDDDIVKEKFQQIAKKKKEFKEVNSISKCIDLISTLPSDKDDTYKELLQNIAAQRKAYVDMIKGKTKEEDIENAKSQYRRMMKFIVQEFLDKIDDDEYNDDDENNDDDY